MITQKREVISCPHCRVNLKIIVEMAGERMFAEMTRSGGEAMNQIGKKGPEKKSERLEFEIQKKNLGLHVIPYRNAQVVCRFEG